MDLYNMNWLHFLILVLSSYRLTHLIVFDSITAFLRKPFLEETYEENEAGNLVREVQIKGSGIRYWIGQMISCYWCTGVWSAAGIVLLYWLVPMSFPVLLLLAISGAAAIIETKV